MHGASLPTLPFPPSRARSSYNYAVKSTGDVITFVGNYKASTSECSTPKWALCSCSPGAPFVCVPCAYAWQHDSATCCRAQG